MKVFVQPFFSQQNKASGKFLLNGCLTVRISTFIASRLAESGHEVTIAFPHSELCEDTFVHTGNYYVHQKFVPQSYGKHLSNKLQRLDFHADWWAVALNGYDLLLTCNELLPAKVRRVFDGKIALLNNLFPMGGWEWMRPLQEESWALSDVNAFMSDFIVEQMGVAGYANTRVWPMVYDADRIKTSEVKDVDVLFVQRCSASNYTHHEEFLEALPYLKGLNVVFADPTWYLEKQKPELNYAHAFGEKYYDLLARTRVVVALMTGDVHGGTSVREAIVSGANPVFLRYPHYEDIVRGNPFQGWTTLDPESIAAAVHRQLLVAKCWPDDALPVRKRVAAESYQAAWPKVLSDLETVCRL